MFVYFSFFCIFLNAAILLINTIIISNCHYEPEKPQTKANNQQPSPNFQSVLISPGASAFHQAARSPPTPHLLQPPTSPPHIASLAPHPPSLHLTRSPTPQRVTIAQFHLSPVNCISYPLPRLRKPCPTSAPVKSCPILLMKNWKSTPLGDSVHFKMAAWGVVSVITKWIVQWRDLRCHDSVD